MRLRQVQARARAMKRWPTFGRELSAAEKSGGKPLSPAEECVRVKLRKLGAKAPPQ